MNITKKYISRVKTFLTWLLVLAVFQLGMLIFQQLSNSLDFLGINDMGSIKTALKFFNSDIIEMLFFVWWLNLLGLLIISLPFIKYLSRFLSQKSKVRYLKLGILLTSLYYIFVFSAVIRVPTLFAETLYGDGTSLLANTVEFFCSSWGPYFLVVGFAGLFLLFLRHTSKRYRIFSVAYYGCLLAIFAISEYTELSEKLPKGSVVVLVADSFRSDYYNSKNTPKLWNVSKELSPTLIRQVIPPVARTAPAVTSLLTGKYPGESKVTTMFSSEETWGQAPTLANYFRFEKYCTIAIAEYPGEIFRKYIYGFEFVSAPRVRFREITLQTFLKKDPFVLSLLVHRFSQQQIETDFRDLVKGLPIYGNANHVKIEFNHYMKKCGGRPIFAFVFADQPHFPYVQTWPHYLRVDQKYSGRYKYSKDVLSSPKNQQEKDRIRLLYASSLRAVDQVFAEIVSDFAKSGSLKESTVFVTGDHGESLYDELDIMGHGDQIAELKGISVPWISFGKGKEIFEQDKPLPMVSLAGKIMSIHGFPNTIPGHQWPEIEYYVETGIWMADTPNLPKIRMHYPELAGLLTIRKKEGHVEIRPRLETVVEYSKHRLWKLKDDSTYSIIPLADRVIATKDGVEISTGDLPKVIKQFLRRHYGLMASLWLE